VTKKSLTANPTTLIGNPFNQASCCSAVGLILPDDLSFEEWREAGFWLGRSTNTIRWWVGDWLLHGDRKFGEMQAEVQDITGLGHDSLADAKWMAKVYILSRRRKKISWGHHREVAGLPQELQEKLLDAAESENLKRWQLRDRVRTEKFNIEQARRFLERSRMTPEERELKNREHEKWIAAHNAKVQDLGVRLQRIGAGLPPKIQLDNSTASAAVHEELRSLKVDPATLRTLTVAPEEDRPIETRTELDRYAIAAAAFNAISFDKQRLIMFRWISELTAEQLTDLVRDLNEDISSSRRDVLKIYSAID
jgi:hypothetical protein